MLKKQSMEILWTEVGSGVGVNGVKDECHGGLFAPFPLNPALSLGEREPTRPPSDESKASRCSDASNADRGGRTTRVQTFSDGPKPLPLPKGEGRGEGEEPNRTRRTFILPSLTTILLVLLYLFAAEPTKAATDTPAIILQGFQLTGDLSGERASFTLTATAHVENSKGGSIELISGNVALTEVGSHPKWQLRAEQGRYVAVFERSGKFPITLKFNAAVRQSSGWNSLDFRVAPSVLQPIALTGLKSDTQFRFAGAARPELVSGEFKSFLPPDGSVKLSWKEARAEVEGKLFYAAEMLSQISINPGLMRQLALIEGKVMQGELSRIVLLVRGQGNVTAVQGADVLAWNVEPGAVTNERRLVVQFNQPQKDAFTLQVQMQTELGAFPQSVDAMQLRPDGATRFAGHFRVVNEGAVRLEVSQATGLSQISPEQFPETDATKTLFATRGNQRFAFRFASADFGLRVQADNVLPELSVSQVLAYHLGETELAIDGEFELDIREAPLREVVLRVPKGFAIARLVAAGMSDYFLQEPDGQPDAELRIVYGQPIADRQVIQLRLERNGALGQPTWTLPRVEVAKAKSTRGHVAVSADAGIRLTPERTVALTDIATALFPRKVAGIQSAFRLSDPAWEAALRVERLPQSIQADVFHLFSIGEGIAYGSSTINYLISGAPVSALQVALSEEYFNVEFTGKDVRNWQKTTNGWLVQLHTPVSGTYTLLATCERPFKAQGDTLTFTGARPLDAQSEQGHTLVVSAYQFDVKPANVSLGLLPLETAEVPAEYRLFFDAPVLAAYRYSARPFNLQLTLSPYAQGETLGLIVDRASLDTRISKDGEVLTDARYFVKNRGNPHFRLTLPPDTTLWSVTVNGATVVPVKDGEANLIPLPQHSDPNAVQMLDMKLASRSKTPSRVTAGAPIITAPVLLAEWRVQPDTGQRLIYRSGSLAPSGGVPDNSGFAGLARLFRRGDAMVQLGMVMALVLFAAWAWRWASAGGTHRFSVRHLGGTLVGFGAVALAVLVFTTLFNRAGQQQFALPQGLSFLAPVQQSQSALSVEVANVKDEVTFWSGLMQAWPALLGLAVWAYGYARGIGRIHPVASALGWTLIAWAALRWPNGAPAFFVVLAAFLIVQLVVPALRGLFRVPLKPVESGAGGATPVTAAVMVGALLWLGLGGSVGAVGVSDDSFPLTPALSLGESEDRSPRLEESEAHGAESGFEVAQVELDRGNEAAGVESVNHRTDVLPLPKGEGWGEGEGTDQKPMTSGNAAALGLKAFERVEGDAQVSEHIELSQISHPLLLAQVQSTDAQPTQTPAKKQKTTATSKVAAPPEPFAVAESVLQDIRVEEKFALATANIRWTASRGEVLPVLSEPAVLTGINFPSNSLTLAQVTDGGKRVHQLLARRAGTFAIEVRYQVHVSKRDGETGLVLPTRPGLVNRLTLTLRDLDVDVISPKAVSTQLDSGATDTTVASLVLAPGSDTWIGWKPRSRDVKREKAVFFAELFQLFAPAAGVVEGVHQVMVRPAQGELSELIFDVPGGATITDVIDPARAGSTDGAKNGKAPGTSAVSLWRFDPDTRKLRVSLNPPQSRPFTVFVRSQIAAGPLPFDQGVGLLSVNGAAGQLGAVGIATGSEVQLDSVMAETFSSINLEDFPGAPLNPLRAQIAGLTLRRAFRYADANGRLALKASAVEPDVRVETQETLSLGDDRTVLAVNAAVAITRAGIFRLSFLLATNLDVESISGTALSHWTELRTEDDRIITLHLKGKTEGQQQFNVSLAGPGTKATTNYSVPRLVFREAGKQRGQLVIVPEQGMRLQIGAREGVTQLDPQKSGIRQKGVLAFRLLQPQWNLALDIERVDAWVQVTGLQHVTVSEAQIKVAANLQYQIENTALKAFRVRVPTNAESVRFRGEQVADFLPVPGTATNELQTWEVKLHRRVIGKYLLQANWQTPVVGAASNVLVRGVQALDANLQRGFVTVQSGGRLQVRVEAAPAALQPAEWQSIPRGLLQDLQGATANYAFRLVEPDFQASLALERHEAAKLLPARVNSVTLASVISDEGVMLTQVKMELIPGDKRLLNLTLPADARFWFAFVNQNGVWPWREQDRILIPLEQQSQADKPTSVELFYSSRIGAPGGRKLDLALVGPKFDLPLENITWQVYLNDKWQLAKWSGTLQLQEEERVAAPVAVDVQSYLKGEVAQNQAKTKAAEEMLSLGNSLLERGNPQQARRAFQSAFGLSLHDNAFNEDARVQLHNLKLQQALVGLNVRQNSAAGDAVQAPANLKQMRERKDLAYTQQEAKQIIDANNADDNAALMKLAERLVQQQDAAVTAPAAIRASIPQQGRLLTFRRAVQVDTWADLNIRLAAGATQTASRGARLGILCAAFLGFGLLAFWAVRMRGQQAVA